MSITIISQQLPMAYCLHLLMRFRENKGPMIPRGAILFWDLNVSLGSETLGLAGHGNVFEAWDGALTLKQIPLFALLRKFRQKTAVNSPFKSLIWDLRCLIWVPRSLIWLLRGLVRSLRSDLGFERPKSGSERPILDHSYFSMKQNLKNTLFHYIQKARNP